MPKLTAIKLMIFDVDGVLTDGSIILDDQGRESKRFHVRDGFAIKAVMSLGLRVGVITGRASRVVTLRMQELGVQLYLQEVHDKAIGLETLCARAGLEAQEVAYMGDDLIDLPAMLRCGYPMAVADAVVEVREVAKFTTQTRGGHGAAREGIEHILRSQGRWKELLEKYEV